MNNDKLNITVFILSLNLLLTWITLLATLDTILLVQKIVEQLGI